MESQLLTQLAGNGLLGVLLGIALLAYYKKDRELAESRTEKDQELAEARTERDREVAEARAELKEEMQARIDDAQKFNVVARDLQKEVNHTIGEVRAIVKVIEDERRGRRP